jgi:hypothetical protein
VIRREDVADLQPGDVVELADYEYAGVSVRGPLRDMAGVLVVGPFRVRHADGEPFQPLRSTGTLTVVSRVPRLYVNHPRTEPVAGDVVRDADSNSSRVWLYTGTSRSPSDRYSGWCFTNATGSVVWTGCTDAGYPQLPARLRLLVDGETGDTVPVTS